MPEAHIDSLTLHYDTFGDARDEPVVLIMGLGAQMTRWRAPFCEQLAARGRYVVRFDNRDIGLSTKLHGAGVPSIPARALARYVGASTPPYRLSDMAADTVGLMRTLGLESAHLVGVSMGGMIAQRAAIDFPQHVRSLTSIMSSTGGLFLPPPSREALRVLLAPAPKTLDEAVERFVQTYVAIGSPRYRDMDLLYREARADMQRSRERLGVARQLAAVLAGPPRTRELHQVRAPAQVLHGALDPLLPVAHGRATAAALSTAEFEVIEDMAHDLPEPLWPRFLATIDRAIERSRLNPGVRLA
jgi:pimeloyl-ACP methyl ester carboxylesterase